MNSTNILNEWKNTTARLNTRFFFKSFVEVKACDRDATLPWDATDKDGVMHDRPAESTTKLVRLITKMRSQPRSLVLQTILFLRDSFLSRTFMPGPCHNRSLTHLLWRNPVRAQVKLENLTGETLSLIQIQKLTNSARGQWQETCVLC